MKDKGLILTVGASTRTIASCAAVYATLADLSTHLVWGGWGAARRRACARWRRSLNVDARQAELAIPSEVAGS